MRLKKRVCKVSLKGVARNFKRGRINCKSYQKSVVYFNHLSNIGSFLLNA